MMIADRFMDFVASGYKETPEQPVEQVMAPGQQPGDVLMAEAPRVHPRTGRPITGPTMSDITEPAMGLANMGAATLKGAVQGFVGLPGDIEALGYGVKELLNRGANESMSSAFIRGLQDKTIAPTTEEVKKWLDSNVGVVGDGKNPYETIGEVLAPGGQLKAGKALIKGATNLAPTAGEMVIKSMDKLGTPVMMNAVPPGPSAAGTATKAMAPASDIGFYSAVEKAALNVQRNSGSGQAFLNDITKGENVKLDEIKWMGLDDFLKGKKNVTKQEVQDFVQSNRVDVQEVELSEKTVATKNQAKKSMDDQLGILNVLLPKGLSQLDQANLTTSWAAEAARGDTTAAQKIQNLNLDENTMLAVKSYGDTVNQYREAFDTFMRAKKPKFNQYQLPGGENYREILLTLPSSKTSMDDFLQMAGKKYGGDTPRNQWSPEDNAMYEKLLQEEKTPTKTEFRSSHFSDPNILAHMRVNDRVDADGKKMLLIEEVQSDWHQAGREKGYQNKSGQYGEKVSPEEYKRGVALQNQQRNQPDPLTPLEQAELNDIMSRHEASIVGGRVPDAPFKDTWYQLALKRALRYAADNGYDRVGLTTGKQQAERYNLAKQVDEVIAKRNEDGTFNISATMVNGGGSEQSVGKNIPVNKLSDYVGKDLAKSIQAQDFGTDVYSGDELKVGGEGMKKYYDDIYPKFLEKYGKKWNAGVGETSLSGTGGNFDYYKDGNMFSVTDGKGNQVKKFSTSQEAVKEVDRLNSLGSEPVRYIDITPEMRKSVKKGQPLAAVSSESTVA
jgi:hypothetical protein